MGKEKTKIRDIKEALSLTAGFKVIARDVSSSDLGKVIDESTKQILELDNKPHNLSYQIRSIENTIHKFDVYMRAAYESEDSQT